MGQHRRGVYCGDQTAVCALRSLEDPRDRRKAANFGNPQIFEEREAALEVLQAVDEPEPTR